MSRRSLVRMRWGRCRTALALSCSLLWTGAPLRAQTDARPQDLYDCTTLTDPAELQQCITENQGGRKIRGKLSTGVKPPDSPIYQNAENPSRKVDPLRNGPP